MRHLSSLVSSALFLFVLCLTLPALAASAPTQGTVATALTPWLPLIVAAIGLAAMLLRSWTPSTGFWHTSKGHALITLLGGVLGSVGGALQQSGFDKAAIITALAGALAAFAGALKPAGTTPTDATKTSTTGTSPPGGTTSSSGGTAALVLFFALSSLALPSCACQKPEMQFSPACRVLNTIVDCSVANIGSGFTALVAAILPAITGNQIDWNALKPVEGHVGTSALACALQRAVQIAEGMGATPGDLGASMVAILHTNRDKVKANVDDFLRERHIVIVTPRG